MRKGLKKEKDLRGQREKPAVRCNDVTCYYT